MAAVAQLETAFDSLDDAVLVFNIQVSFRGLNGGMPETGLDLLERGMAFVGKFCEAAAGIVGGDFEPDPVAVLPNPLKDRLRGHARARDAGLRC